MKAYPDFILIYYIQNKQEIFYRYLNAQSRSSTPGSFTPSFHPSPTSIFSYPAREATILNFTREISGSIIEIVQLTTRCTCRMSMVSGVTMLTPVEIRRNTVVKIKEPTTIAMLHDYEQLRQLQKRNSPTQKSTRFTLAMDRKRTVCGICMCSIAGCIYPAALCCNLASLQQLLNRFRSFEIRYLFSYTINLLYRHTAGNVSLITFLFPKG
jgi:hypothetical protein